jgi:hypothetical protein
MLVSVRAEHGLRQATVSLIMTLVRNMKTELRKVTSPRFDLGFLVLAVLCGFFLSVRFYSNSFDKPSDYLSLYLISLTAFNLFHTWHFIKRHFAEIQTNRWDGN